MLHEFHLKLFKSCSNSNTNRATYKKVFGCTGRNQLFQCLVVCVFEFLTPFTLEGYNFLICNPFWTNLRVSDESRGGVQVLLGH
jgi:hypothetical protein